MISLTVLFSIFVVHWIADFICQSDDMAKSKSTSNLYLLFHTFTYSVIFFVFSIYLGIVFGMQMLWFAPITFVFHTLTDYATSRLNTYLYKKGDIHNFFVSVGFDQILHYTQLIFTFLFLL